MLEKEVYLPIPFFQLDKITNIDFCNIKPKILA
jgi:hypothetical protein